MEMRRYPIELAPTPIPIACISGTPPWCPSYTHSLIMEKNMNQPILPSPAAEFRNDPCTRDSKMANPGIPIPSHHSRQYTSSLPSVIRYQLPTLNAGRELFVLFIHAPTSTQNPTFPKRRTSVGELQRCAHARTLYSVLQLPSNTARPTDASDDLSLRRRRSCPLRSPRCCGVSARGR